MASTPTARGRGAGHDDGDTGGWGTPRRAPEAPPPAVTSAPPARRPVSPRSKEVVVELYEHERWSRKADGWIPVEGPPARERAQWCTAQGTPAAPPEEMHPPAQYGWASNWRVDTSSTAPLAAPPSSSGPLPRPMQLTGYTHDREGWEYATAPEKFGNPDRTPRGEERWSDRARRRRWIRVARYKALLSEVTAPQELGKQAQEGLKGLVRGRRTVQELCGLLGSRRDSADLRLKMFNLVDLVRQHGQEIDQVLRTLRDKGGDSAAVGGVKKWANDLAKEQRAFEDVAREVERKCRSVPLGSLGHHNAAAARGTGGATSASASSAPQMVGGGGGAAVAGATEMPLAVSAGKGGFRPFVNMEGKVGDHAHHHTAEEAGLLKQLKFQDEEEVMEALMQERELAITEVTRHIVELKDVFTDFAQLVQEQQEGIDAVCQNVDHAHARTEDGYDSILKAHDVQKETGCVVS